MEFFFEYDVSKPIKKLIKFMMEFDEKYQFFPRKRDKMSDFVNLVQIYKVNKKTFVNFLKQPELNLNEQDIQNLNDHEEYYFEEYVFNLLRIKRKEKQLTLKTNF